MNREVPKWLIQSADGNLHGYFTRRILRLDLLAYMFEDSKLFEVHSSLGRISYIPMSKQKFLEQKEGGDE